MIKLVLGYGGRSTALTTGRCGQFLARSSPSPDSGEIENYRHLIASASPLLRCELLLMYAMSSSTCVYATAT